MGPGEEIKTRPEPNIEILEKGEIFFFYRPKVDKEEAHGPDDVQRIYIVLCPESGKQQPVEEKQASESGKEGRKKGRSKDGGGSSNTVEGGRGSEVYVDSISSSKHLRSVFSSSFRWCGRRFGTEEYDTATRGHRHRPPARALAEGVYRILRHVPSGRQGRQEHTHLVYQLEFPPSEGEPQESLNVQREASFLVQIKNPEVGRGDGDGSGGGGGFRGLQSKRKAAFPARLQGQFGGRRFIPADPPDFLNYEGCELLLISASDDIEEELGLELKTECEADADCSDLLQMFGEAASTKPLLSGTWV